MLSLNSTYLSLFETRRSARSDAQRARWLNTIRDEIRDILSSEDSTRFPRRGQTMAAAGDVLDRLCLCVSSVASMTRTCTVCEYDLHSTRKHSLVWVVTAEMLEQAYQRGDRFPSAALSFQTHQRCGNCDGLTRQTVHSDFAGIPPLLVIELPLNVDGHTPCSYKSSSGTVMTR